MNPHCIFWYITSHGHYACNSALKSWSQSSLQKQECFNLQMPLCRVVQNICMNETLRGGSTQGCSNTTTIRDVVLEG